MFTGIVEELGQITGIVRRDSDARLTVRGPGSVSDAQVGDSICVDGVCLTVAELHCDGFTADVMGETLRASALGDLGEPDSKVSQLVAERGGVPLMPELGYAPVNRYLPMRPRRGGEQATAPVAPAEKLDTAALNPLLRWLDRALSR